MIFETERFGRVLRVRGELDTLSVPRFQLAVAELDGLIDCLDLSDLGFIDSSGIRALVTVRRRYPTIEVLASAATARLVTIVGANEVLGPRLSLSES